MRSTGASGPVKQNSAGALLAPRWIDRLRSRVSERSAEHARAGEDVAGRAFVRVDHVEETGRVVDAGEHDHVLFVRVEAAQDRAEGVVLRGARRRPLIHEHALRLIEDDQTFRHLRRLRERTFGQHRFEEGKAEADPARAFEQCAAIELLHGVTSGRKRNASLFVIETRSSSKF
jgi:hypothetical protein